MLTNKISLLLFTAVLFSINCFSQTLFTYGTKTVSKEEFLKAYNKNPDSTGDRAEKIKQYLDLYINFKLKLQAATDEKLSADANYKYEADNFRTQLIENYINDQANVGGLVKEAYLRSQKDILLSHVFVEVKQGGDTTSGYKQIREAYNALQSGRDFTDVVTTYSSDGGGGTKGIIGYVTAFTLPYEIENIIYSLAPNTYAAIYRSNAGYHIFKNISERPAAGKRKIQQILFAVPESFTPEEKATVARLSDSVYRLLKDGASFEKMLQLYSAPNNNYESGNTIEVGVGQYYPDFENRVFALQKPGDVSEPFETSYGYNIVRLSEILPVSQDENDVVAHAQLQEKIEQDNRLAIARSALINNWLQLVKYIPANYNTKDLWAYTDSALKKQKALPLFKNITPATPLFSFAKEKYTVADWFKYIKSLRDMSPYEPYDYSNSMKQFVNNSGEKYYRTHIEEYYPPIAAQLKEFNEANLLFSVMDKHVWGKAAEDSVNLKSYYSLHKDQYKWQPGVTALIVSSSSKDVVDSIAKALGQNAADWRIITAAYGSMVMVDSSRFEDGQLPLKQAVPMQRGFISATEQSETGDAYTLAYIFNVNPQPGQRSFEDAKGMVINDYQQVLEQKWLAELKKKYPVKTNDAVVKSL